MAIKRSSAFPRDAIQAVIGTFEEGNCFGTYAA
jgi:hypothetical protein